MMRAVAPVSPPGPVPPMPDERIEQRDTGIGQLLRCEHRACCPGVRPEGRVKTQSAGHVGNRQGQPGRRRSEGAVYGQLSRRARPHGRCRGRGGDAAVRGITAAGRRSSRPARPWRRARTAGNRVPPSSRTPPPPRKRIRPTETQHRADGPVRPSCAQSGFAAPPAEARPLHAIGSAARNGRNPPVRMSGPAFHEADRLLCKPEPR